MEDEHEDEWPPPDARYRSALSLADRQAIVDILRDTKKDLPRYFQNVTR